MHKRNLLRAAALALALAALTAGCGVPEGRILAITREDGSGTRGAFAELFGLTEAGVDRIADTAEVTNNTAVVLMSVAGDRSAIGYVSLGSLNASVKALAIDGVAPSLAAIYAGEYQITRPFSIVTQGTLNAHAQDFYDFILSAQGQAAVEAFGCLPLENAPPYAGQKLPPGVKVRISGSTSVSPLMEKLIEAYLALNPGAEIELETNDSTTGVNNVLGGISDIGMISRSLKGSETEKGLTQTHIATDGIAVIVHPENETDNLSSEQVREIYAGEITSWAELKGGGE